MKFKTGDKVRVTKVGVDHLKKYENQVGDIISWIPRSGEYRYKVMFDNESTAYFKDTELERVESDMGNGNDNINKKDELHMAEIKTLGDLVQYMLGGRNPQKEEQQENKNTYPPQIGDVVAVTEGQFKGIEGEIISEVCAYHCYQIKVNELNAIYVDKGEVKVVKRKEDTEKAKKIKDLKLKINEFKTKHVKLEKELELVDETLDGLCKELEELEE